MIASAYGLLGVLELMAEMHSTTIQMMSFLGKSLPKSTIFISTLVPGKVAKRLKFVSSGLPVVIILDWLEDAACCKVWVGFVPGKYGGSSRLQN